MSRSLGNGTVRVELGTGSWRAEWPAAGVHAGPFHASIVVDGLGFDTRDAPGTWNVSAGSAFGRAGAWARWTARDGGVWLRLHLPAEGALIVAEGGIRADADATPAALVLAVGPVGIAPVDDGPIPDVAIPDDAGPTGREALLITAATGVGPAFGVQALHGGDPVGTAIHIARGPSGPEIRVVVLDPGGGRARGVGVRSEAVAFGAGADPHALADALAALASRTAG